MPWAACSAAMHLRMARRTPLWCSLMRLAMPQYGLFVSVSIASMTLAVRSSEATGDVVAPVGGMLSATVLRFARIMAVCAAFAMMKVKVMVKFVRHKPRSYCIHANQRPVLRACALGV